MSKKFVMIFAAASLALSTGCGALIDAVLDDLDEDYDDYDDQGGYEDYEDHLVTSLFADSCKAAVECGERAELEGCAEELQAQEDYLLGNTGNAACKDLAAATQSLYLCVASAGCDAAADPCTDARDYLAYAQAQAGDCNF